MVREAWLGKAGSVDERALRRGPEVSLENAVWKRREESAGRALLRWTWTDPTRVPDCSHSIGLLDPPAFEAGMTFNETAGGVAVELLGGPPARLSQDSRP